MMRQWTLPQQYVDCWAQIRDKTKFMITWSSCSKCVKLKMCNMRTNFLFTRLQTRKCIFPFGRLSNFLETMLWVRLRCSRVWRINHQKCVTFLPIAQPLILSPQNCPLLFHCPEGWLQLLLSYSWVCRASFVCWKWMESSAVTRSCVACVDGSPGKREEGGRWVVVNRRWENN